MGLTNVCHLLARTSPPPVAINPAAGDDCCLPAPKPATVLKHCRCIDCLNFSCVGGEYFCSEYIGGTSVVWATGQRFCDPPPEAWHYCAGYHGPQISPDIWAWPKASPPVAHGRPRANIWPPIEQSDAEEG